jgi:glucose/arabinose dehydrogenase
VCAQVTGALATRVFHALTAEAQQQQQQQPPQQQQQQQPSAGAPDLDAPLRAARGALNAFPLTAAVKAVTAAATGDARWLAMRPPLLPLPAERRAAAVQAVRDASVSVAHLARLRDATA